MGKWVVARCSYNDYSRVRRLLSEKLLRETCSYFMCFYWHVLELIDDCELIQAERIQQERKVFININLET
jgi:hypothetical protein